MSRSPFHLAFDRFVWGMLAFAFLAPSIGFGQLTVTCPGNIVQLADPNYCGAVVNYNILYNTNLDTTISLTGGMYGDYLYWQVPNGVGQVHVELWGGQGNRNANGAGQGGLGGHVNGDLPVVPGEYLYFEVGSGNNVGPYGNWSGGGYEAGYSPCYQARGGGGGGSSSVMQGGTWIYDRVMVAGGGGGAGGDRVQGCGRGTGGGGGGGWYGGGGGAAWPQSSLIVPSGGDQSMGGAGGTSTYSSIAPYNNGSYGQFYYGGYGGEEQQSSQAGSGTGATGGNAGGLIGAQGAYIGNFTGQSGAGGSSYISSVVLNGNITTPATWAGTGKMELTYPQPVTRTLLAGDTSGAFFPLGTTNVSVEIEQSGNRDTCNFTVRVEETISPNIYCPSTQSVYLDQNCSYSMPDYTSSGWAYDNCTPGFLIQITQSPLPSTTHSDLGIDTVWLYATDNFNNIDSCMFSVNKLDGSSPVVDSCPSLFTYQPYTLDCYPSVTFNEPTFLDNCPGNLTITSTHQPGDNFATGTTTVTYVATDQAGYFTTCSFVVDVGAPIVDSIVDVYYSGPCQGDTVTLAADPGYNFYSWSTSQAGDTIQVVESGTYILTVRNALCIARDTFTVSLAPAPTPILIWDPDSAHFCTSQPFASYQWYRKPADTTIFNPVPGAIFQCYQPTQSLYVKVQVTHAGNSCVSESNAEIRTAVEESMETPGFLVYPNPAGHVLNIEITDQVFGPGTIRLFDLQGKVVIEKTFEQLESLHELNLSGLPAGSYTLEILHDETIGRAKIIHLE